MGVISPKDMVKDHKQVLLPLLGAAVVLVILSWWLGNEGDYLGGSGFLEDGSGGVEGPNTGKQYDEAPEMQLQEGADYQATIKTNYGDFTIDLYEDSAPVTVNNFVFLSNEGFYDGLTFHRVVDDFIIQGGDPSGDGTGGPGYSFKDEIDPTDLGLDEVKVKDADFLSQLYSPYNAATAGYAPNSLREHANDTLAEFYDDVIGYDYDNSLQSYPFEPGVIAMANSGPNTNGSQFFVTVSGSDSSNLNGRHTVFGKVIEGMDVVDEIGNVLVDAQDQPVDEIVIEDIVVLR